jgi:REP element-mobilizing transposase RayT
MHPQPKYSGENLEPAYHLRYSWAAWPSQSKFFSVPDPVVLEDVSPLWEGDGMRLLERFWAPDKLQLTFSATPSVSPVFLAARAKGRLQHALRQAGYPTTFSRKVSVRTVGNNRRADVEAYIAGQVDKEAFADPRFEQAIRQFTVRDQQVDLAAPSESARGRYWYNLHLVLVVAKRFRIFNLQRLACIRDGCFAIARKKGYAISNLSVMPDHLHVAMRGHYEHSPLAIALSFQNNLAYLLGQEAIWKETFYTGTFSEYDMGAIRSNPSPQ